MTTRGGPIERPPIENYSDAPIFNTKAVAQQTGVPAPTLRAWERRYTVLSPERANNAYRLYSERDISLIRWLKERIDEGMSISQAIALFRHLTETSQEQGSKKEHHDQAPVHFDIAPPSSRQDTTPFEAQESMQSDIDLSSFHTWAQTDIHTQTTSSAAFKMQATQHRLVEIFQNLDEQAAHIIMGTMFSMYSLEQVCTELITPTLWQIGQQWKEGKLTVSVEHFASNFFRALLANRFYVTPGPLHGPLVITACAPHETHELPTLMLALFLRRSGLHVAYLGQSIETTGLLHTIQTLQPALICLSLTHPHHLHELITLGNKIQSLPTPRPLLVFGGQALTQHKQTPLPGIHMDGNLQDITTRLYHMVQKLSESRSE